MITTSYGGMKSIRRGLQALAQRAPNLLSSARKEVNRRHAQTYRRRSIPVDTGRLRRSLVLESGIDRRVQTISRGVEISSLVPYAQYQERRIARLSREELKFIFVEPILEHVRELTTGGGV